MLNLIWAVITAETVNMNNISFQKNSASSLLMRFILRKSLFVIMCNIYFFLVQHHLRHASWEFQIRRYRVLVQVW